LSLAPDGSSQKYTFEIKNQCSIVENVQLIVHAILTSKNSGSKKLYQIQCMKSDNNCFGVEMSLANEEKNETEINLGTLYPKIFSPEKLNFTKDTAQYQRNNSTLTVNVKTGKIEIINFFEPSR
jgi:hypothetical protein